jgi:Histone methylation protein DOT1
MARIKGHGTQALASRNFRKEQRLEKLPFIRRPPPAADIATGSFLTMNQGYSGDRAGSSEMLRSALQTFIEELEQNRSLDEPDKLRQRLHTLELLETHFPIGQDPVDDSESNRGANLHLRAEAIYASLEAVNLSTYRGIRRDIRHGAGSESLLRWVRESNAAVHMGGERYDYLDELISGVLQFNEPSDDLAELPPEMVFYQPTPARHIFDLIERVELTEQDVLVDLGSGLGHVPLLASICSGARSIGIELEAAYVDCAQRSACALNLNRVSFVRQDARAADFSAGTVFYLYTPFTGTILRTVLDSLRREATGREIRVCTFGPCTPIIAKERWLKATGTIALDRVAIFRVS